MPIIVPGWPPSLPQVPQKGYSETGGVLIVRTPTDSGPAKLRARGKKPDLLNVQFLMTKDQVTTFENFVKNQIRGVLRFTFPHPRLSVSTTNPTLVEVRIVPQGEGDYYTLSYAAPDYYNVQLQLEILP